MASIVNAVRNIFSDTYWLFKILVFSIPLFLIINNKILYGFNEQDKIIVYIIVGMIYLGASSVIINRNVNNITPIIPSFFSIFDLFKNTIFVSFISVPLFILYFYVMSYMINIFSSQPIVVYIVIVCITLIFAPFLLLPTVYYSVRNNLLDAINIKLILDASGNFAVAFLSFLIQYVMIFGFIGICIYKLLTTMLNDTLILNIVISIFIVLSVFTLYSYCSDLYPDVIPEIKEKSKKRKN